MAILPRIGTQDVAAMPVLQSLSTFTRHAPAKLNWYLRVLARRADGFHELETVMVRLRELGDTLRCRLDPSGAVSLTIVSATPQTLSEQAIPATESNLVIRAARALQQQTGTSLGVQFTLIKRVPAAAGMGGGSSDAAAALEILNRLWNLELSRATLLSIAADLGSDVPFFLAETPLVLCTGRGEILTPIPGSFPIWVVVARPKTGLSTPAVFRNCRPEPERASAENLVSACESRSITAVAQALHNTLQSPAVALNPEIGRMQRLFERERVVAHQMTGSGSAYFGVCTSKRHACCVAARLRAQGVPWVEITSTQA